jgi:hypothetical protein
MPFATSARPGAAMSWRLRGAAGVTAALLCSMLSAPDARAQTDWTHCANEGRACRVGGEALVRYGTDGRYAFRLVRDRVVCRNDQFGGDPAPNQVKRCEVSANWRSDERYRGWRDPGRRGDGEWRACANENELCRPPAGATRVRYGADGRYEVRPVSRGAVMCSNRVFGDPAPNIFKQCEYSLASGRPETAAGRDGDRDRDRGRDGGRDWESCAREGEHCDFRGRANVRYGADGHYVYREASGGLGCTNEVFNADPAPGRSKHCEIRRGNR